MPRLAGCFHYRGRELHCEQVPLKSLAQRFATPAFVYSGGLIAENCARLARALRDLPCEFFYSVKANSNLRILRLIAEQGFGFDVVSGGELQRLLSLGIPGHRILFSGVGKSRPELELARQAGIRSIQAESLDELRLLAEMGSRGNPIRVGVRANPRIQVSTHPYVATGQAGHKFGIHPDQLPEAFSVLRNSRLELASLGCHIGSQIKTPDPYAEALEELLQLGGELSAKGLSAPALDLGGGFAIPYQETEREFDFAALAKRLSPLAGGRMLFFEPGRSVVGAAGILLTRVLYRKSSGSKQFLVCDAAMNDLIRPALYGARHQIVALEETAAYFSADLVGPICESGDFLAQGGDIPDLQAGNYLAILDVGAYGSCLSSNYNSRLRAPEILVSGDTFQLIRRRETFQDLVRCETEASQASAESG